MAAATCSPPWTMLMARSWARWRWAPRPTRSNGALAASTSYDAWGNPQTSGGLTSRTPFGYAGGYTDPTGLVYLIHRYYDPQTGQFLSVDPAISQTQQPYQYTGENPVNTVDPAGLAGWGRAIVSGCECYFSTEEQFELTLAAYFAIAGIFTSWHVLIENLTSMTTTTGQIRIPDIYIHSNSPNLLNWINELKIGYNYLSGPGPGTAKTQIIGDKALLAAHGGLSNYYGVWFTVNGDVWWFAPDDTGFTYITPNLLLQLVSSGINVIELFWDGGNYNWPIDSGREEDNDTVRDIESNNRFAAEYGLDEMCGCQA